MQTPFSVLRPARLLQPGLWVLVPEDTEHSVVWSEAHTNQAGLSQVAGGQQAPDLLSVRQKLQHVASMGTAESFSTKPDANSIFGVQMWLTACLAPSL